VGVGGAPRSIYSLVRPQALELATRGVNEGEKEMVLFKLELRVMVDGVRDFVGEEGKTKSVCEDVGTIVWLH